MYVYGRYIESLKKPKHETNIKLNFNLEKIKKKETQFSVSVLTSMCKWFAMELNNYSHQYLVVGA